MKKFVKKSLQARAHEENSQKVTKTLLHRPRREKMIGKFHRLRESFFIPPLQCVRSVAEKRASFRGKSEKRFFLLVQSFQSFEIKSTLNFFHKEKKSDRQKKKLEKEKKSIFIISNFLFSFY